MSDKGYKPILLQVCITDVLNLAITFFYMPVYIARRDYVLCYTTGVFNDAFQDAPIFTMLIFHTWFLFHFLAICSPAVQFLYRYLVLCRKWTPSYRIYGALLSVVILILLMYILTLNLSGAEVYVSRSFNTLYQEFILTPIPSNVDLLLINQVPISKLFSLILGAIIILDYGIIVVCGLKIWLHLRRHFHMVSNERNRCLQRQINYVLLVQALLPIFGLLLPVSIYTYGNMMKADIPNMPFIFQFATLCVMSANPLFTILLIESYRCTIFGCFSTNTTSTKIISAVDFNAKNFP